MIEAFLALGFVGAMAAASAAWWILPLDTLLLLGLELMAAGLLFGLPTGAWYHVELRRALLRNGELPARWWLQPTRLHGRIPAPDRRRVLGWCLAGAAGFGVTVLGCAVVAIGALRALQAA